MANRVTDVCGESIIHGIASEISRQRAGCKGNALNWRGLDFIGDTLWDINIQVA